jgi:OOP family OmpA-OmpF porin
MKKILIATALLASSSVALAEGVYVGGSVGYTHANVDCTGTTNCKNNSTGEKAFVGYKINDMFAVEASYFDLGKVSGTVSGANIDIKSSGFGLRGLISAPFSKDFSGFAALGVNSVKSKATVTLGTLSGSLDTTTTKPSFAIGVDYSLTQDLKLRGEVESFRLDAPANSGSYNVANVSVGLKYSF